MRDDERRAGNNHRADDERKERLSAREAEAREAECQRRRDESRDHDSQHGDDHAIEEIDIELFLAEDVHVVFKRDRVQHGEELRRELIERTVRL